MGGYESTGAAFVTTRTGHRALEGRLRTLGAGIVSFAGWDPIEWGRGSQVSKVEDRAFDGQGIELSMVGSVVSRASIVTTKIRERSYGVRDRIERDLSFVASESDLRGLQGETAMR